MGQTLSHYISGFRLAYDPEVIPSPLDEPTFDPNFGYPGGRQERVMIATEEEMLSAKLPLQDRDYCAHLLLEFRKCRTEKWPWAVKCKHVNHAYLTCRYEDFILRMMEYERERRLRLRRRAIYERDKDVICDE